MITGLIDDASNIDKLIISLLVVALTGIVHAISYTAAEGSLRVQRLVLRRCADLLVIAGVLSILRLWTGD